DARLAGIVVQQYRFHRRRTATDDEHATARLQPFDELRRDAVDRGGHADRAETALGLVGKRVGVDHVDVGQVLGVELAAGGVGQVGVLLKTDHVARKPRQASGQVAAAGADL